MMSGQKLSQNPHDFEECIPICPIHVYNNWLGQGSAYNIVVYVF